MQTPTWLRPPKGIQWTPRLAVTLALVVIAGVVTLSGMFSLLLALLTFGGNVDPATTLENSLKKHEQLAKVDRDRFDGRSAFFMPPAPVRNIPKPAPPPKIEKPLPPPAPVISTEYLGDKPKSVLGPIVYFESFQIKVGEESNGIKVLATNAPWSVKLGYKGGEYDVVLWTRYKEDFFNSKWPTTRTPGIETSTGSGAGKDKNMTGIGGRMGTPGTASHNSTDHTGSPNGATPSGALPGSSMGTIPNTQVPPTNAGPGFNRPGPGTDLPEGAPLPNEPIRPPLPDGAPSPNAGAAKKDTSPSKNNGWNSSQMASPAPITSEQINGMQLAEATAAQATLNTAKANTALDLANKERIANELAQISQRINELKGQSSPP